MLGRTHSTRTKKAISKQMSGVGNPMFGEKHSDETRKMISQSKLGQCVGEKNHFFGKRHHELTKARIAEQLRGRKLSEETKKKISLKLRGKLKSTEGYRRLYKSVVRIDPNTLEEKVYESINSTKSDGFMPSEVVKCCTRRRGQTSHRGYQWKYKGVVEME